MSFGGTVSCFASVPPHMRSMARSNTYSSGIGWSSSAPGSSCAMRSSRKRFSRALQRSHTGGMSVPAESLNISRLKEKDELSILTQNISWCHACEIGSVEIVIERHQGEVVLLGRCIVERII